MVIINEMLRQQNEEMNEQVQAPVQEEFDKEAWVQQKWEERAAAFSQIDQMLELAASSQEHLVNLLNVQSRFPRYSVGNALLIAAQKPDATKLADYKTWKDAGTQIKWGEAGIVILGPGSEYTKKDGSTGVSYNTKKVYDISQTTSEVKEKKVHRDERLLIKAILQFSPCKVLTDEKDLVPKGQVALYRSEDRAIYVSRELETGELFKALSREMSMAHLDKGGRGGDHKNFLAYCVSYMLSSRYGLDVSDYDFSQIPKEFSDQDKKAVREDLIVMRDILNSLDSEMQRYFDQVKEQKNRDEAR